MINIQGIGWISSHRYGMKQKAYEETYSDKEELYSKLKDQDVLGKSIKNIKRFDDVSLNTCFASALALCDAGFDPAQGPLQDLGIISTNEQGCMRSNSNYFKDYVESGRQLSRGNLFIYTLPSTPIAEAAITIGCQGPVAYFTFEKDQTGQVLEQGRLMIELKEAAGLLVVNASDKEAICFYLKEETPGTTGALISLENTQDIIKETRSLTDVIKLISR